MSNQEHLVNRGPLCAEEFYNEGVRLEEGTGVERDAKKAVEWYERAADHHPQAMYRLGNCFENGIGVARDEKTAVKWFQRSVYLGNAQAMHRLINCLQKGVGLEEDDKKVMVKWFRQVVSEKPHSQVMFLLGFCLANGIGVKQDAKEAMMWFQRSADLGLPEAIKHLGSRPEHQEHQTSGV